VSEESAVKRNDKRPELGPIKEGDEVIVVEGFRRKGGRYLYRQARVIKANRVWIEVEGAEGDHLPYYLRRFRRDDQTDGRTTGTRNRFLTPEQQAWDEREGAAREYLIRELQIEVYRSPRWANDIVTLANIIREHEGLDLL
jgi:hypothetical protein